MIPSLKSENRLRNIITVGKLLFTLLAMIFLAMAVWQSRSIIRDTLAHSLPVYLFLSILAWLPAYLLSSLFVKIVLNACGITVPYRQMLDLHLRYLPARYIPGGIWYTVARISKLQQFGITSRHLSSLIILENLIGLGVSLTGGGILVGLYQAGRVWQPIAFLAAASSLIVLILCPVLMNRFIIKIAGKIWYRNYILAVIIAMFFWSSASTSFLLFISALPNSFVITAWVEIIGAYLFSWGVGFIAIFAPQGVGVFEVVAADIMPTNLPLSALVALLAGFRLVVIMADIIMWLGWMSLTGLKGIFLPEKATTRL